MFVLGIDPGVTRCGYGVVARERAGLRAVACGVLTTPPSDPLPQRLASLNRELRALLAEFTPQAVVVERVFFQTNVRTAMSVGQASGLALAAASAAGCEVAQYTANEVKQAVTGYGAAAKEQVQSHGAVAACRSTRCPEPRRRRRRPRPRPLPPGRGAGAGRRGPGHGGRAEVIGSLRGILLDRNAKGEVLVEVGGVGYRVQVPTSAHSVMGELGSPVFLHVHTHVREDALVLYGFPSADERVAFEALIATHGIGPAVAMDILSVHSPAALRRAVATDDVDALTLVPGIGKKTAARLLLELTSRLDLDLPSETAFTVVGSAADAGPSARNEVRNALAALGYGVDEVREAAPHPPRGRRHRGPPPHRPPPTGRRPMTTRTASRGPFWSPERTTKPLATTKRRHESEAG